MISFGLTKVLNLNPKRVRISSKIELQSNKISPTNFVILLTIRKDFI